MVSQKVKDLKEIAALAELGEKGGFTSLLHPGAERYGSLLPHKRGSWRAILVDLDPVAIAWTDWDKGFDIITLQNHPGKDRLDNYVISCKALDISAGWAYTSLDEFVKRLEATTLDEQQDGALRGALEDSNGLPREEAVPAEEEENDTEA